MDEWRLSLSGVFERAWAELRDFQTPRGGPPGLVTLATVGPSEQPDMRVVVLQCADRDTSVLEIHSDQDTAKIDHLRANPLTSVLIWCPTSKLQIRLNGSSEILVGDRVSKIWQSMSVKSRTNYGVTPPPGSAIKHPNAFERIPELARLAVLRMTISNFDVVHLGQPHDVRATFQRADNWKGQWLSP